MRSCWWLAYGLRGKAKRQTNDDKHSEKCEHGKRWKIQRTNYFELKGNKITFEEIKIEEIR